MATTPDEIRNKTFSIAKRGYDRTEVSRYLSALADNLQETLRKVASQDEIIIAEVVDDSTEVAAVDNSPEPAAPPATISSSASDEFDRVGNEISLMLRQAQESAIKIRNDAEVEARTLVDQVRLDIEADRLAHEQAASELISRTEKRAGEVRAEAEDYASQTKGAADTYSTKSKETADSERAELTAAAEADRELAAEKLAAASADADKTVADARQRSEEIMAKAEADAQARADQMLSDARTTLRALIDAEQVSRDNLELARKNIDSALSQLRLTDVDSSSLVPGS